MFDARNEQNEALLHPSSQWLPTPNPAMRKAPAKAEAFQTRPERLELPAL